MGAGKKLDWVPRNWSSSTCTMPDPHTPCLPCPLWQSHLWTKWFECIYQQKDPLLATWRHAARTGTEGRWRSLEEASSPGADSKVGHRHLRPGSRGVPTNQHPCCCFLKNQYCFKIVRLRPGWYGSVDWVLAYKPKGSRSTPSQGACLDFRPGP